MIYQNIMILNTLKVIFKSNQEFHLKYYLLSHRIHHHFLRSGQWSYPQFVLFVITFILIISKITCYNITIF